MITDAALSRPESAATRRPGRPLPPPLPWPLRLLGIAFFVAALGLGGLVLFAVFAAIQGAEEERALHSYLSERIDKFAALGVNPIELSLLALHPVERVCLGGSLYNARATAAHYGLRQDGLPDAIVERMYGLFLVGPAGEVTYGALHESTFTAPSTVWCYEGARLAIRFATIDPTATGGILVDLAAPDPTAQVEPVPPGG